MVSKYLSDSLHDLKGLKQSHFCKQLSFRNELIFMLNLDRIYTKPTFFLLKGIFSREKATAQKSTKVLERSQR